MLITITWASGMTSISTCPNCPIDRYRSSYSTVYGDQFEQKDTRWVQGLRGSQTYFTQWCGMPVENTFGLDFRNDVIHDTLNRTYDREVLF